MTNLFEASDEEVDMDIKSALRKIQRTWNVKVARYVKAEKSAFMRELRRLGEEKVE